MVKVLTAAQILGFTAPEQLFTSAAVAAAEYKELAKQWHPDANVACKDATKVFGHISALWALAETKIASGNWDSGNLIERVGVDGKTYQFRFQRCETRTFGKVMSGKSMVATLYNATYASMADRTLSTLKGIAFRNPAEEKEFGRLLPKDPNFVKFRGGEAALIFKKTPDVYRLKDIASSMPDGVPAVHVAWMLNRLYGIACFLNHQQLSHNAICVDNIYISPQHHSALLYGGWEFAASHGNKIQMLPQATSRFFSGGVASATLDSTSIRAIGRELLGPALRSAPPKIQNHLRAAGTADVFADWKAWEEVLLNVFGPPKFCDFVVNEAEIYK